MTNFENSCDCDEGRLRMLTTMPTGCYHFELIHLNTLNNAPEFGSNFGTDYDVLQTCPCNIQRFFLFKLVKMKKKSVEKVIFLNI